MLSFTDIGFWIIFVFFLAIYFLVRHCSRYGMMLYVTAFSLAFFSTANGWTMLLLPLVAGLVWVVGRWLPLMENVRHRKWLLIGTIVTILMPLVVFKYAHLIVDSLNLIFAGQMSLRKMIQPVGISFFTFQAISYVVDVYRGRFTMRATFLELLFYLSFFPLLFAGPITRAQCLLPQVRNPKPTSSRLLYLGLWLVLIGLMKKCVVADYIAQYNNWIFADPTAYSGFECLCGILGYAVQIYFDFSGYSDMSIGVAAMMGFRLDENFNFPYLAQSVTEFWHRWHISLSTWFRDYVYIPLGGNKKGTPRTYANLFLTMVVAGLWHGSTGMFLLWGTIHGLGLIAHKSLLKWLRTIRDTWYVVACGRAVTFMYVALAWVFFRCDTAGKACMLIHRAITQTSWDYFVPCVSTRPLWFLLVALALCVPFMGRKRAHRLQAWFIKSPWIVKLLLVSLAILTVIQFQTFNVQPFIYYQF